MRTEITPGQDSDDTGYNLVMADNLPQPAVLVANRGYDPDKIREDIVSRNALPFVGLCCAILLTCGFMFLSQWFRVCI